MLGKVGEESGVRKVLKAGSIIRHHIQVPRKKLSIMMIAVLALMIAGIYTLMGARAGRSHGPFAHPGDGRHIIAA